LPPAHPSAPLCPYTTLFRSNGLGASTDADNVRIAGRRAALLEQRRIIQLAEGFLEGRQRALELPQRRHLGRGRLFQTIQLRSLRSEEHTSELQSRENLVCRL